MFGLYIYVKEEVCEQLIWFVYFKYEQIWLVSNISIVLVLRKKNALCQLISFILPSDAKLNYGFIQHTDSHLYTADFYLTSFQASISF